jgi:serine/threonine protein kinase
MTKSAATLELDERPEPSAFPAKRGSMKFAYVSGSRPLDGYTLKRGIGRGGFGEVYFAVSDAGKEVAVKKIERNLDIELRGVVQCINLRHENLVELYDVKYDDQEEPWVVMEYIAGASLKDILDANPRGLPEDEVHNWFRGIAAGVAYLHDKGIVHRDLKPANVFDDNGTVKIGDYGLSKYISCSRRSGNTESVGTCHYMAPEIGRGEYGKEIDIYALGIVLFELLTGTVPFDGESSQEVLMKHLTADPDLGRVPEKYRALIARALQKDAQYRYSTVDSLLAEFEMVVKGDEAREARSSHDELEPVIVGEAIVSSTSPTSAGVRKPVVEPIYIGDSEPENPSGIELGPVKQGPGKLLRPRAGVSQPMRQPQRVQANRPVAPGRPVSRPTAAPRPDRVNQWLHQGLGGTVLKLIVAAALLVVLGTILWRFNNLVPLVVIGGLAVIAIGVLRHLSRKPALGGASSNSSTAPQGPMSEERMQRWALRMRTPWDRMAELSGSFLTAALVAAVMSLVMAALTDKLSSDPRMMAFQAWLVISSTAGAWLLLAAGKVWEGEVGEPWKRRFVLLMLGLACGAFCWGLNHALLIDLTDNLGLGSLLGSMLPTSLQNANGALAIFLLYFAATFVLVPWWKHTDPTRESRLSVGAVMLVAFASLVFPFPQPWGLTIAVASAVAAQLAASWLSPEDRTEIERRYKQSQA